MTRFTLFLSLAFVATGCNPTVDHDAEIDEDGNVNVTTSDELIDLDGNGHDDLDQSIVLTVDNNGEPFAYWPITNPELPSNRDPLKFGGHGCSVIDGNPTDDWIASEACKELVEVKADGEVIGYAFTNVPNDGIFEGAPVDPVSGVWADVFHGQTAYDDPTAIVMHIDWTSCPLEQQELATHYGFRRVDDVLQGLGESVAPPNENCSY
jgi:hypothetical protein